MDNMFGSHGVGCSTTTKVSFTSLLKTLGSASCPLFMSTPAMARSPRWIASIVDQVCQSDKPVAKDMRSSLSCQRSRVAFS